MKKKDTAEKDIVKTPSKGTAKKYVLTTEIFKGKDIPGFIQDHRLFKNPTKIKKIFPAIGLSNFKESCNLTKPLLDLKKDNFVTTLITAMLNGLMAAKDEAQLFADKIQYLLSGETKAAQLGKIDDVYNLMSLIKGIIPQIDTYNNAYEKVVQTLDGKIVLRLAEDVCDKNGKAIFKKNESLLRVLGKLREQFTAYNLNFINIEQTNEFKTFSAENVTNKNFTVVFSSDGIDGAWDILTMSMRGLRSCQRWDGEYHRCLIGSLLSKFVGIIYITSGADFDNRGSKMMRRAIVRYAIDAYEQTPCILIDKLYPDPNDDEALKVFVNALKSKTTIPIYYGPHLAGKTRHFYTPFEKRREDLPERDWTYQDTPLKTNIDFQLHVIASASNEDFTRYTNCFRSKLVAYLGEKFRSASSGRIDANDMSKILNNIRLNSSFDKFNDQVVRWIFDRYAYSSPRTLTDNKECYRKYLMHLSSQLKSIGQSLKPTINQLIDQSTSRSVDHALLTNFLFGEIKEFTKQEFKSMLQ